jgi:3-ketosteroid 9alpha-monooxygenase subunit A
MTAPRFPFPATPNSWYHLVWSDELPRGRTLRVPAFSTVLLARRRADGVAEVMEERPRARRTGARLWTVREQDGMILVHYHADGAPPSFEVPPIALCSAPGWLNVGRAEWILRSHIQELVENSVDLAHFQLLHRFSEPAQLVDFGAQAQSFSVTVSAPKLVLGVPRSMKLTIEYHGMGVAVGRTEGPLRFANVVTNLPLDAERMRLRFHMFARVPRVPVVHRALAAALRWHVRQDVEDEMTVLEHKRYLERPVLAAGDGPIMSVRRWCRQFYPPTTAVSAGVA